MEGCAVATLKDVAKLANVDVSTVSRALNNTSYVHPDTKERIYAAAKELGYHPNTVARALKQGRGHVIGVVVPRLHMTIFSEILQGIEEEAQKQGYMTMVCVTEDDPKVEKDRLNRMRNGGIDGIIIAATGRNGRLLRDIQASGIAVVQLVRRQELEMSSVVADFEASGREAVQYLYNKGCRAIGLIAGAQHLAPYRARYEGYRRAVEKLGLEEITGSSDKKVNSFGYGYDSTIQLLDENPDLDAIIAAVDVQGLGAIRAVAERGIKVPEQIKIMSLTGHRVGRMLETTMTSIEMPAFQMGETVAQLTIDEIEADAKHKPAHRHINFAQNLVEREST